MLPFNPEYAFVFMSPISFVMVTASGFALGVIFFRAIHLKNRYLWNYLISGETFIWIMFFVRSFESTMYPSLIGVAILYVIFIGAIALGNYKGGDVSEDTEHGI
jgi:hypothetical protein